MHLKKAMWSEGLNKSSQTSDNADSEPSSTTAVEDLINSLKKQRLYREVTLALRTNLRDARAEFSFLRLRSLRSLLNFLGSVAYSDFTINLFCHTQSIPDLQVVPVLFQYSLKDSPEDDKVESLDHVFGVEPMKITSLPTDAEVTLALRVLEGCCLLHRESTVLAHQQKAIQVLMHILSTRGIMEQGACLDALISIMLESSANQMELWHCQMEIQYAIELLKDFEECNGIEEVTMLIRDKQVDENLRLKCGEFLLLLIGHVNGRERPPMATIHEDIRRLLGEKSASLIWGSTLDPEQRLTGLQIQARRVLESLDLY